VHLGLGLCFCLHFREMVSIGAIICGYERVMTCSNEYMAGEVLDRAMLCSAVRYWPFIYLFIIQHGNSKVMA